MIRSCCGPKTFTPSPGLDDAWFAELEKKKREMYRRFDMGKYETDEIIRSKMSPSEFPILFEVSPRSKTTMEEIDLNGSDDFALPSPEDLKTFLGVSSSSLSPALSPSNSLTPRSPKDIPRSEAVWISKAIQVTKLDLAIPAHRERLNDRDVKQPQEPRVVEGSVFIRLSEDEPEEEFVILEDEPKSQSMPAPKTKKTWRFRTKSDTSLIIKKDVSEVSPRLLEGKRRFCGFA